MKHLAIFTSALVLVTLCGCQTMDMVKGAASSAAASAGLPTQHIVSGYKVASKTAKAFEKFTPQNAHFIGRASGASLLANYPVLKNKLATRYVNLVGQTLVAVSPSPTVYLRYRFLILDTDEVNAFALPGGLIFVTRGLIKCCKTEDELAAVLAHEIGHVQLDHGLKAISKSRFTGALSTALVEGTKSLTSAQVGQLAETLEGSVSDITLKLTTGYDRSWELEADAQVATMLAALGYDAGALVSFLKTMGGKTSQDDKHGFGATHPPVSERIEALGDVADIPQTVSSARKKRFALAFRGI